MKKARCDLCHNPLPIIKKLYDETDRWVIIDCKSCLVPMIVWKKHTMYLEEEESKDITKALTEVADKCYGEGMYYIDKKQRSILNHLHWHARPIAI